MVTDSRQLPDLTVSPERCETLLRQMVRIRSVVGEDTTAHLWVSERLGELGMTVEQYAVEGRRAPLVLGVLEGQGDGPGILFDAHFDTVHARPGDWSHDPWAADVALSRAYGGAPSITESRTGMAARRAMAAAAAIQASRFFMPTHAPVSMLRMQASASCTSRMPAAKSARIGTPP